MAIVGRGRPSVEATPLSDLMLPAGVFTAVNAFVRIQGSAIGLAVHAGVDFFGPKAVEAGVPETEREL